MTRHMGGATGWLATLLLLLASASAASAELCEQRPKAGVAMITGTGRAYFHGDRDLCPKRQAYCLKRSYVIAGDRVLTSVSQDGYTCVSMPGSNGTTSGWIETKRLQQQAILTAPPSSAWEGVWESEGVSTIRIDHDKFGLQALGVVDWESDAGYDAGGKILLASREHHAEFDGRLRPSGNHARIDSVECHVAFILLNDFLLVDDGSSCEPNTSFTGIYRRRPKQR